MTHSFLPETVQPCLWMTAGLLAYRLCDRDFDCEHCPLDAALRGGAGAVGLPRVAPGGPSGGLPYTALFPEDRRYTGGHLWLRPGRDGGPVRLGVDAFAAALLGDFRALRPVSRRPSLQAGQTCCDLELDCGLVPLSTPVSGRLGQLNPDLEASPDLLGTRPYDDGWLLELQPARDLDGALDPDDARHRARMDLRRFRRSVALHLLSPEAAETRTSAAGAEVDAVIGPTLADGGLPLTDLRQVLGERRWLAILRDLVH